MFHPFNSDLVKNAKCKEYFSLWGVHNMLCMPHFVLNENTLHGPSGFVASIDAEALFTRDLLMNCTFGLGISVYKIKFLSEEDGWESAIDSARVPSVVDAINSVVQDEDEDENIKEEKEKLHASSHITFAAKLDPEHTNHYLIIKCGLNSSLQRECQQELQVFERERKKWAEVAPFMKLKNA